MSNRTAIISFGYSHKVAVPATLALKVAELLDGHPTVDDTYTSDGTVWYEKGENYSTSITLLGHDTTILSVEEYEARHQAREADLLDQE